MHLSIIRTRTSQLWHSRKCCTLMYNTHLIFHSCHDGWWHGCLLFSMSKTDYEMACVIVIIRHHCASFLHVVIMCCHRPLLSHFAFLSSYVVVLRCVFSRHHTLSCIVIIRHHPASSLCAIVFVRRRHMTSSSSVVISHQALRLCRFTRHCASSSCIVVCCHASSSLYVIVPHCRCASSFSYVVVALCHHMSSSSVVVTLHVFVNLHVVVHRCHVLSCRRHRALSSFMSCVIFESY